jgi:hypothetical protein
VFQLRVPSSAPRAARSGIRARGVPSQCAACSQMFAGARPFDDHRTGPFDVETAPGGFQRSPDRRCLTGEELAVRFKKDARGFWTK